MKKLQVIILGICSLISFNAFGQLSLKGDFRPRAEYRHGYKSLAVKDADAAFATSQRTRFNLGYKAEKYTIGFSFQDIRTWGSTSQLNATDGFASVHEAWGQVQLNSNLALKLGRQEVAYDDHRIFGTVGWAQQGRSHDHRIFGTVGWAQQGRSHDLALFKFEKESGIKLHVGFAFNQDKEGFAGTDYTTPKNYKSMQYAWFHKGFGKSKLSLLFLNNGVQYFHPSDTEYDETRFSQTIGGRFVTKVSSFNVSSNVYYQMGQAKDSSNISAYLVNLDLGYSLNEGKSKIGLGFEMQSGTNSADQGDPNKDNTSFTPFYGTNHKFNGHMDYFYVGNHTNSVGLMDIYASFNTKISAYNLKATVHSFSALADISDATKTYSKALGTEIDLSLGRKIVDGVSLTVGYSHMLATESLQVLKGGDYKETNNWGWIMVRFTPDFLK